MKNGVVDKLIYHVMKMIITMELPRVLRDKLRSFQGVYLNMIQGYVRILQGVTSFSRGRTNPALSVEQLEVTRLTEVHHAGSECSC